MDVSTRADSRRAWIEVNLANLVANARTVQAAGGGVPLLPMVKANAYGLGAARVIRALEHVDIWGFGVATGDEGAQLRAGGITRPILVFTPAASDQRAEFARMALRAVIDDPLVAAQWDGPFHVEIDTGMSRCGVRWTERDAIARCATPHLEGVFTHLHSADGDAASVRQQLDRFAEAVRALGDGARPLRHVANSAGTWRVPERFDLVRPGIFLYGGEHAPDLAAPRPVATVRAPVVSVRRVAAGDTVSYGATWTADRDTTIATAAIGYADGVPRALQDRAAVLLAGKRFSIVGRVTMDFIMIDVGAHPVAVGDVATIVGCDGDEEITINEFADWAGTISYEALTRLGPRLERRYVD